MTVDADDDAPYGYNPNTGKPYRFSAEERQQMAARMTAGRQRKARTGAGRASGTGRASVKGTGPHARYTETLLGFAQIPTFVLQGAARLTGRRVLALDAIAVQRNAEPLASAVATWAVDDARFGAWLERTASFGPYGAVIVAGVPLLLQIGANHGYVAPMPEAGILAPEELMLWAGLEVPAEDADPVGPPAAGDIPT